MITDPSPHLHSPFALALERELLARWETRRAFSARMGHPRAGWYSDQLRRAYAGRLETGELRDLVRALAEPGSDLERELVDLAVLGTARGAG